MTLIGYRSIYAYKLYNSIDKIVHISMNVVFDESDAWNWKTKNTKEGDVRNTFVYNDQNEESDGKTNNEVIEIDVAAPVESHAHKRPQRRK